MVGRSGERGGGVCGDWWGGWGGALVTAAGCFVCVY